MMTDDDTIDWEDAAGVTLDEEGNPEAEMEALEKGGGGKIEDQRNKTDDE
jgi:hypothetical protein